MERLILALALAAAVNSTAPAAPADPNRLFADSRLLVRDRISVEVVGHGPDLVLIPGLSSSRETWKATAARLKGRYRLHLVQVAGFAGEAARANAAGEVLAPTEEAIDAYIRDQKLAPAVVIGHSLGGTMALMLAERHPQDLKKVMLVDALPFYGMSMAGLTATPASVQVMAAKARDQTAASTDEQYRTALTRNVAGMVTAAAGKETVIGWGIASDHSVVARALYDDLQTDLGPDLPKVTTPVTLLYPDYTPVGAPAGVIGKTYTAAFAAAPTVRTREVEHSLHFIMFDQPAAFDQALDDFLKP
jgi:pimeloyl-[acyl-carrier protein] methyl ester esterase